MKLFLSIVLPALIVIALGVFLDFSTTAVGAGIAAIVAVYAARERNRRIAER